MNKKHSILISSLQKDYEISSWNEQGEITRIEGILTIAFFISVCSHRDRKQLYLIMKIPYTVNMQYVPKKDYHIPGNIKIVDGFPKTEETEQRIKKLEGRIKELELENKILKEKITELTKKVEDLKQENQTLKEKLGIVDSEWQFVRDLAKRINPITKQIESYNYPLGFETDRVEHLHLYWRDKDEYEFDYYVGDYKKDKKYEEYRMSISLYEDLCKKEYEKKKQIEELQLDIHKLQNEEDINNYILSKGGNLRGKYLIKAIKFIYNTRGKSFEINEFDRYCGFKDNRESRRQYIKKLIEWELIKPTGNQRVYQNLI